MQGSILWNEEYVYIFDMGTKSDDGNAAHHHGAVSLGSRATSICRHPKTELVYGSNSHSSIRME